MTSETLILLLSHQKWWLNRQKWDIIVFKYYLIVLLWYLVFGLQLFPANVCSISSSYQSHSHAIRPQRSSASPVVTEEEVSGSTVVLPGNPRVRRSTKSLGRRHAGRGQWFNLPNLGGKELKMLKNIQVFCIHSCQKVGPAPLFPRIQSELRFFR